MARKLDDIFNECYERIRFGESLESCLRSYPQYRAQLEPLLRTTFDIGRRMSYIQPRPEFRHWARVRFETAQRYPRQQTMAAAPAVPAPSAWLRHGWAVIVSAGIVLLLTTGSTMAASSQALPTEPLYPVKLATEQVQRVLTVTPERKAQLETDIANIRAAELETLANAGQTQEAAKAAQRYNDQFARAVDAIVAAGGTEPQPTTYVPPSVATPPVVTTPTPTTPPVTPTPPVITTPSAVTPTSENTTPPVTTTPPAVTTPPATTTPPSTASENTTPPVTITPPAVTTPPATTTPPTTGTHDNGKAAKNEKLRESLNKSTSKSLSALKDAKDKASQNSKDDWQKAIDSMKKNQQPSTNNNNGTGNQGNSGSAGSTSQPTVQSDNNTAPNTTSPSHNNPPSKWHGNNR